MEAFFIILLAYQTPLNRPRESHTAAVFVRATAAGEVSEEFTISWLPARLKDDPGGVIQALRPEPGANFTREETLRLGRRGRRDVVRWGPFQVRPEFYASARRRFDFLDSGAVRYTVFDDALRQAAFDGVPGGAVNCIHALSDVTGERPPRTGFLHGGPGTEAALAHFLAGDPQRNFIRYPVLHEWLADALGLSGVAHARRLPRRGADSAYDLAELEANGGVRRSLDGGSSLFTSEVAPRLGEPASR